MARCVLGLTGNSFGCRGPGNGVTSSSLWYPSANMYIVERSRHYFDLRVLLPTEPCRIYRWTASANVKHVHQ